MNDTNQNVNFVYLASTPATVDPHTVAIVTSGGDTIVYANASGVQENIANVDMEIHLDNVTNLQSTDFILH